VFYWVSSPEAQHTRNLAERPEAEIVIFDSTAPVGQGEAVYITASTRAIPDDELGSGLPRRVQDRHRRTTVHPRRPARRRPATVRRAHAIMRGPRPRRPSRLRPWHRHPPAGRPHRCQLDPRTGWRDGAADAGGERPPLFGRDQHVAALASLGVTDQDGSVGGLPNMDAIAAVI
jgi:hypothetical protein